MNRQQRRLAERTVKKALAPLQQHRAQVSRLIANVRASEGLSPAEVAYATEVIEWMRRDFAEVRLQHAQSPQSPYLDQMLSGVAEAEADLRTLEALVMV